MSCAYTVTDVAVEVVVKATRGANHLGCGRGFLWLGARVEDFNPTAWLTASTLVILAIFILSLILYRMVKARQVFDQYKLSNIFV